MSDWLLLFVITIGFLVAYFIGFASLALFEKYLKQRFPRKWVYLIMLAVFELTSLAVFLGRFLRLNSWDIFLNSGQLLAQVIQADYGFGFSFILGFKLYLIIGYAIYQGFRRFL